MRVTFLGGADEVGASCALVEMAGHRFMVDCGIRMSPRDGDRLPWLSRVQEEGGIEAIVVTHAHTDHTGALPVIIQGYPTAPIYLTHASMDLMHLLFMDALKIMEKAQESEGEVPLYPLGAVEMVIGASCPVEFGRPVELCGGDIRATYYPAGHILGAASVFLESRDGSILFTGDISVTDQLTIPGMMVPAVNPDLVVIESTYGGKLHAARTAEEKRIISQVGEVVARGGAVLFPAFAIGRAQEVILILSRAIRRGQLPQVPLYVDGMVQAVCTAYHGHSEILTPWLRGLCDKHGNPFFHEGSPATAITSPKKRREAAKRRPAIFVSSSGMLTGGPSQFYAETLAPEPESFIAITGYQDEESPGRQVQELARAGGGMLRIGHRQVELRCSVGTYGLSAHADTGQIVGILTALKPGAVALVHGDHGAREAMSAAIRQGGVVEVVHLPAIGASIEVEGRRGRRSGFESHGDQPRGVRHLDADDLPKLAETLASADGLGRYYTIQEVLRRWDPAGAITPEALDASTALLSAHGELFERHRKRAFLFRVRPAAVPEVAKTSSFGRKGGAGKGKNKAHKGGGGVMDPNTAQKAAWELLADSGLHKVGARVEQRELVLSFHFPAVAQVRYAEACRQITEVTGWSVVVRPEPHQGALVQQATSILPTNWDLLKNPSIHLADNRVVVHLRRGQPNSDLGREIRARFRDETGFDLSFEGGTPEDTAPASPAPPPATTAPRMEINQAYATIRDAFADSDSAPLKTSLKENAYIEVAFITPQIGERHQALLDRLRSRIGWPIRLKPQPDQHRLKELAKQLIPAGWTRLKEPQCIEGALTVRVKVAAIPDLDVAARLGSQMQALTGYQLELYTV